MQDLYPLQRISAVGVSSGSNKIEYIHIYMEVKSVIVIELCCNYDGIFIMLLTNYIINVEARRYIITSFRKISLFPVICICNGYL